MDDLKDICELLGILRLKELIDLLLQLLAQRFFVFSAPVTVFVSHSAPFWRMISGMLSRTSLL